MNSYKRDFRSWFQWTKTSIKLSNQRYRTSAKLSNHGSNWSTRTAHRRCPPWTRGSRFPIPRKPHRNEDTTQLTHWLVLPTETQWTLWHSTRNNNIRIPVDANTRKTTNTGTAIPVLTETTYTLQFGETRAISSKHLLDRPQCHWDCHKVFTNARPWKYFHYFFIE